MTENMPKHWRGSTYLRIIGEPSNAITLLQKLNIDYSWASTSDEEMQPNTPTQIYFFLQANLHVSACPLLKHKRSECPSLQVI